MKGEKSGLYNNTIRQLKSINFVLLTLTSVMAVFVFLTSKDKIEAAIDDLKHLESVFTFDPKVKSKPPYGTVWLEELAEEEIKSKNIDFNSYYYDEDTKIYNLNYEKSMLSYGPLFLHERLTQRRLSSDGSLKLDQLKEIWDGISRIDKVIYVKSLSDYIAKYDKDKNKFRYYKKGFYTEVDGQVSRTGKLSLVDVRSENWIDTHFSQYKDVPSVKENLIQMTHKPNVSSRYYIFGNVSAISGFDFRSPGTHSVPADKWEEYEYSQVENAFSGKIFIPARVGEIGFYPQKLLIENIPSDFGWKLGSFSVNFVELDEFTKGYQDIPIDKIKVILEKELERSPGSVSAFGLSIPFSILSKFGVLAIIVVQTYFLLYLIYLHRTFESEDGLQLEVPWVFMHGSTFSAIAFVAVSIAYPASIAIYFSWINISTSIFSGWVVGHFGLVTVEIALVAMLIKYTFSFRHIKDVVAYKRQKLKPN